MDLDEIWGTPSILFGAVPDKFWAQSAQKRQREGEPKFCFFWSIKQRAISSTSGRPNFTKFAQKDVFPCPHEGTGQFIIYLAT